MYLCFDYVKCGTGKDCVRYSLRFDLEENTLKIHTFKHKREKLYHKDTVVNISAEEAEMLKSMETEEERLNYIVSHQTKWCV